MTTLILVAVIGFIILVGIAGLLSKAKTQKSADAGFQTKASVLSPAEKDFHHVLRAAFPSLEIFPKIRVADVIEARNGARHNFLKISQKHFDWVICEPETMTPVAVIELDDSSHSTSGARRRDETKTNACESATLPLIRFVCRRSYDVTEIRRTITAKLDHDLRSA